MTATNNSPRILSALIITVMTALLLAACGGGGTTTTEAPTTAPAAATEAAAVTTEATEATAEAMASGEATAATGEATAATAAVALPDIDPATVTGDIISAGSSTVYPLSERMAENFKAEGYAGQITIDSVGTGAGFERFCNSETDISNASRAINDKEKAACESKTITPIEFRVGTDALVVVVSAQNDFLTGLTLGQLADIYSGSAKTWADVDPSYPAEPIQLFSPGTDSGTFDYFVEKVFAAASKDQEERKKLMLGANPQLSEDDNVLVQGVEGSPYAIGYFGFAYYKNEGAGKLKALTIEGVEPNEQTAESNEYPISRPLFIYSDAKIMKDKPQVASFINYYLTNVNDEIVDVGYFPASGELLDAARQAWLDSNPS